MKRYPSLIAASLMLAALAPLQSRAADNTWNNGSTDFLWNGTSLNWAAPPTWVDGDNAIFGATGAGTVTLGTAITVQNQTFNSAGYTMAGAGNTLTLAGTTPTITANASVAIAAYLDGTNGLTVQGTSVLSLLGDPAAAVGNIYTGGTFVKGGTLVLQTSNLVSGTSYAVDSIEAIDAGATVKFFNDTDGVNNIRVPNGQIPIGGVVTTHNLNLTGGTFDVAGDDNQNQVPMPSGTGTILNSSPLARGVLKFTGYGDTRTFSGQIMDGGPVTNSIIAGKLAHRTDVDFQNGSGTIILAGSNSFTGFIRIGPGTATVQLSGAGTLGYPSSENCPPRQVLQNNGVMDLNGTSQKTGFYFAGAAAQVTNSAVGTLSTLTLCFNCTNLTAPANSGIICSLQDDPATSGLIGIIKEGPALQNLNGANNNYHGDTVVNNGTLRIDQAGAISPNSTYRLSTSQGTLELNYVGDALVRGLDLNGVAMPAGTYSASTAPITGTGTITVPPPNTWNNASTDFLWNTTSANWTSPTTWADGGNAIFGATGAGLVTLGTPVTAHSLTFNAGGYVINGGGNTLTLVDSGATITANASNSIAASIAGTVGLTFQGTSILALEGDAGSATANTYTGGTYVRSGTLILQAVGTSSSGAAYAVDSIEALDTGATVKMGSTFNGTSWSGPARDQIAAAVLGSKLIMTGGTLDLYNDPKAQRLPVPDGTGLIINTGPDVQAGVLMIADGQNHTFSGVIADGNGGVLMGGNAGQGPGYQIGIVSFAGSKNGGGGLWTLSGSNTYSGSTRIDQGASIKLEGNGTIGFPTPNGLTGPLRIYGSADPTRGYLDLNGHNQTIALMQNGNADAKVFNSAVGTVSTLTFGYGNEQVARTASFQFMDNQGPGGILALTKIGTNCIQALSGVNTYSGDTTVSEGILAFSTTTAVSSNSAVRLSTSATLRLTYDGTANVRQLWVNGVQQPNGVYGSGTPGIDPTSTGTLTVTGYSPVSLGASRSSNNLTFSWAGVYKLQSKTNNIIGTWYDYAGGGLSPVSVPINPANGSVYFRLSPY